MVYRMGIIARHLGNIVDSRKNIGSVTVEASIIIPLVILSIIAAIYTGLVLYQRALVQSAAEAAAEAGAVAWASGICEVGSGKPAKKSFEEFSLYRRIVDKDKEIRLGSIEEYALAAAARYELIKPLDSRAEAVIKDYAVYRKLEVKITKRYRIPVGKVLSIFGADDTFKISVKAVSTIDEPVELIRNTDFLVDLEKELEEKYPAIRNLGEKTRNAMNELKSRLGKLAELKQ